ncbi:MULTISPECIES: NfeD family protein [Ramlibacter]|uniref:NfeD family protein n=1 Tax=Ramlibacter pinisoli TaxID=2682844 RepID=A0A6N8IXX2_9BURK|nr:MULTISPECIES: NfeD family protein [Ramlibacter]MBA2960849.1 NfeD family protein [Ramlibacter sp. CGMCC 1.13660]MVQ30796.1 NfeD family protein [Ramlibacter pinisoli]
MAESTVWWLLAGAAVAVELVTGSFYLLMLAIGLSAAAMAAHGGAALPAQLVTAAVVGGGAVGAWHVVRGRRPAGPSASANPDVNLDIGETVVVEAWQPDGTAQVRYRGARWTVAHLPGAVPAPGPHRVREVVGNRLIVEKL